MSEITSLAVKADTVKEFMVKHQRLLQDALPVHLKKDWERFVRLAMGAMTRNPTLYECSPRSLMGAVLQCAQLGLEPDDIRGHAYLLPFRVQGKMEVVLVPGYKGLMDLARRSGEISYIKGDVVYSKDIFTFSYGFCTIYRHNNKQLWLRLLVIMSIIRETRLASAGHDR